MNYNKYFPAPDLISWNECKIGKVYYHSVGARFFLLKVSKYMFFDLTANRLSRLNPKYISDNNKIYLKADAAYLLQYQKRGTL